jgi:hypothetical protein
MAFIIPPYEIEDVPMRLEPWGAEFCAENEESFRASFALHIQARAADDWDVTEVYMGTQRVRDHRLFCKFANHLEEKHGADISDHVGENLPSIPKSRFLRQMMGA